jgi:signal transduction histidine kinase/DNA-binding NarL/FixJ family response regulator
MDGLDTGCTTLKQKSNTSFTLQKPTKSTRKTSSGSISISMNDTETSCSRSGSDTRVSSSSQSHKFGHKSNHHFTHFMSNLQSDEKIMIACYDAFQHSDFLSDGVYQVMGFDNKTAVDELVFPPAPCRGAVFFRKHSNGSLLKFRNIFLSTLPTGEVFTMDEFVSEVEKSCLTLLVTPSGVVTRCSVGSGCGSLLRNIKFEGNKLQDYVVQDGLSTILASLKEASEGKNCLRVTAGFEGISCPISVNFYPCASNEQVVAEAFLFADNSDIIISNKEEDKVAIVASKTKSEFLAVMSHELRTPINGIVGATSLLGISTLTEEQRDYVDTITDSADILMSLVSNILDISKIESGKFKLDKVPLRLVDEVTKCTDGMKYRASEKELIVTTSIDVSLKDPNIWHRGDPTRISQVLHNFLSNAVKFTQSGNIACNLTKLSSDGAFDNSIINENRDDCRRASSASSCSTSVCSNSGNSSSSSQYDLIRLEVIDTGCGVADSSKLFVPFVQANDLVHKTYGGPGLGLSVSKTIIDMMHGQIGMSSVEGVGTTVWAEFPLRRVSAPKKVRDFEAVDVMQMIRSHSSESKPCCDVASIASKVRILIAEDNKVNQKVLKRMLETLGYTDITITNNGQEAVDAFKATWENYLVNPRSGRFDIVLMDCLMPVMDGWTATEAMRRLETDYLEGLKYPEVFSNEIHPTVILALTANATEDDKQRCTNCGMDDFYTKPMPRDGLNAMMLRWISRLFTDGSVSGYASSSCTPRVGEY